MSGVLSALEAIGALFGGYGIVTLGPVVFQAQEVPERIAIGGTQALKVHKLPGGQRVIDAMGRDDASLAWNGIMFGPGAEQRLLLLDSLRVSGQPITLAFGTMSYTVVVADFKGDYRRTNWCEYSISCEVVQDNAAQFADALPTLLQQVTGDIGAAASIIPGRSGVDSRRRGWRSDGARGDGRAQPGIRGFHGSGRLAQRCDDGGWRWDRIGGCIHRRACWRHRYLGCCHGLWRYRRSHR